MKKILTIISAAILLSSCSDRVVTMSQDRLLDKIKGGWAGQTFACTFGGPTEFKYKGMMIPDTVAIPWPESGLCKWYFDNDPGLYDDVYMDLTFVEIIDKFGCDAPMEKFADKFANAGYGLCHANQAARYNILHGIQAPQSGYWKNNPHADDIDFQIEADFAGLMNPGMPNSAAEICDKVGHIMNYGDGYYGGLYVASMYALAFIYDDVRTVVTEAIKMIPEESDYHKCISDVIKWCAEEPDWKRTWQLVEDKWSYEISCPHGIEDPYNIDAKLNSAYVVMGLLYGDGDMDRTIEIATRCGADSDCNPATAGGILGTIKGYSNIDEKWIRHIREIEDRNFAYTDISLNDAYEMSFRHAISQIGSNGGKISGDKVEINVQKPHAVPFEKSFEGLSLVSRSTEVFDNFRKPYSFSFEGCAIVCEGKVNAKDYTYVAEMEVTMDGKSEIVLMPVSYVKRRLELYFNYGLPEGKHDMTIRWLNPVPDANVAMNSTTVYTSKK